MAKENGNGRLAILVGGGPAPGINGVISAATIEAVNQGTEVIGFREGFKWLAQGNTEHYQPLTIKDVKDIALRGGSILGTSRANPAKSDADMNTVLQILHGLNVTAHIFYHDDAMALLLGDPVVMTYYPRPRTRAEAADWIRWNEDNYARDGFGLWILHDEEGSFLGDCGLTWQRVDGLT